MSSRLLVLVVAVCLAPVAASPSSPVTVRDEAGSIVLDNGIVTLTVSKQKGTLTSIRYRHGGTVTEMGKVGQSMYFDFNGRPHRLPAGAKMNRADYGTPLIRSVRLAKSSDDAVEVVAEGGPAPTFPFVTDVHYRLARGDSGFHAWVVFRHIKGAPAASLGQTRMVVRGVPGTKVFTHHIADDARKGPFPTSPVVREVMDATYLHEDGTVYTKYDNTVFMADHRLHGMTGHGVGMWIVTPSNEYVNGGPLKQELTVHMDNVLLSTFQAGHFGSGALDFRDGEAWTKVYGPFCVYLNAGPSMDAMHEDARRRSVSESAAWPYAWAEGADFPVKRATVSGRLRLSNGKDARRAWVILAAPGGDWPMQGKGYQFWARADARGRFRVEKVRPGRYTLYAVGADQFEQFAKDDIEVTADQPLNLGTLDWRVVTHGETLWQIGVADRSTAEFRNGDDVCHYANDERYAKDFPDDVEFIIGKSRERTDWNYAHWSWYSRKPFWTIRFDRPEEGRGRATLTFGIASSQPRSSRATSLQVKVNGTEVGVLRQPKTGQAAYRSGGQDSDYRVVRLTFDARLLKRGPNEITLGHLDAQPFPAPGRPKGPVGDIMYDAIRLEVSP